MWFGIQQKYDGIGYIILPVGIDRLYTKSINMVLIKIFPMDFDVKILAICWHKPYIFPTFPA